MNLERREGVHNRVGDARNGPAGALRRHPLRQADCSARESSGRAVRASAIVDAVLTQNLADALHQSAVELRLDQDVVVDFSAVVDRDSE
jgi:hypothetical protein